MCVEGLQGPGPFSCPTERLDSLWIGDGENLCVSLAASIPSVVFGHSLGFEGGVVPFKHHRHPPDNK